MVEIVNDRHIVTVRKKHQCHWCLKIINVWEKAESWTYTFDWDIYTLYECLDCVEFVKKYPDCFEDDYGEWAQEGYVAEYKSENNL